MTALSTTLGIKGNPPLSKQWHLNLFAIIPIYAHL